MRIKNLLTCTVYSHTCPVAAACMCVLVKCIHTCVCGNNAIEHHKPTLSSIVHAVGLLARKQAIKNLHNNTHTHTHT